MSAEPLVIKISGSLVYPPDPTYVKALVQSIMEAEDLSYHPAIVVGGGPVARSYITALRQIGANQAVQDLSGIWGARLNALFLSLALNPRSIPRVPHTIEEVLDIYSRGLIPVIGGFQPGQSTNAVALVVAEAIGAKTVLNLLRGVEGVYDRPPDKPGARLLDRITLEDLQDIVEEYAQEAGRYQLIDHVAIKIARRSKIRIHYVNGNDPRNIVRALRGEKVGTVVEP